MYIAIAVTGVAFKYWTNIIISSTYIIIYYLTDVISTYLYKPRVSAEKNQL